MEAIIIEYTSKDFDMLDPINKYILIGKELNNSQLSELGNEILISLYVVNEILKEKLQSTYSFYICDDVSCKNLLEKSLNTEINEIFFLIALINIDLCKLVYRFTCARKFEIDNEIIKQLRLNSWGHEYIREMNIIGNNSIAFSKIYRCFEEYFEKNKEIYIELSKDLLGELNKDRVSNIKRLNNKIDIKILS